MKMKYLLTGSCLFALLQINAQTIHVAPDGKDSWPGTEKKTGGYFC